MHLLGTIFSCALMLIWCSCEYFWQQDDGVALYQNKLQCVFTGLKEYVTGVSVERHGAGEEDMRIWLHTIVLGLIHCWFWSFHGFMHNISNLNMSCLNAKLQNRPTYCDNRSFSAHVYIINVSYLRYKNIQLYETVKT